MDWPDSLGPQNAGQASLSCIFNIVWKVWLVSHKCRLINQFGFSFNLLSYNFQYSSDRRTLIRIKQEFWRINNKLLFYM